MNDEYFILKGNFNRNIFNFFNMFAVIARKSHEFESLDASSERSLVPAHTSLLCTVHCH